MSSPAQYQQQAPPPPPPARSARRPSSSSNGSSNSTGSQHERPIPHPIFYPPVPVAVTNPPGYVARGPPTPPKIPQYPRRPSSSPSLAAPIPPTPPALPGNTSASTPNSRRVSGNYLPSPLNPNNPGSDPSSPNHTPPSSDETEGVMDKLRKRNKKKRKPDSEEFSLPPPPSIANNRPAPVLSRLLREEAESLANSNWMGGRPASVPALLGASRPASMILYRLADDDDREGQLPRPASFHTLAPPPGNRFSASRRSSSPSFDSKYPAFPDHDSQPPSRPISTIDGGTPPATPLAQGAFLPYEYDPSADQEGPDDEVDELHHAVLVNGKMKREKMGPVSLRGLLNVACVVILILGLLVTFMALPIVDAVQRHALYLASLNGAVLSNPVGGKDTEISTTDVPATTDSESFLSSITSTPTSTRVFTTALPTSTTSFDEDGNPITDDQLTLTPTLTPTLESESLPTVVPTVFPTVFPTVVPSPSTDGFGFPIPTDEFRRAEGIAGRRKRRS